ncbi:MAG: glycosyltransferase family 87 protein [Isosphaeraceae bacterium]
MDRLDDSLTNLSKPPRLSSRRYFPVDPAAPAEPNERTRYPITERLSRVLLVVSMIAFSFAPVLRTFRHHPFNKDYILWYYTGRAVVDGNTLYPKGTKAFPFMYPPSCATFLALGTLAGERAFVIGLTTINSIAWAATILLALSLTTRRFTGMHPFIYLGPTLAVLPFVSDTYLLGQPNLLLLALMLGAAECLRSKREVFAGTLIAIAAAIKAFPVLAIFYLIRRRQWKATASLIVVLGSLLLALPCTFRGPSRSWDDLKTWTKGMLLKYDADTIAQRPERAYGFKNQSIVALANRLMRPVSADAESVKNWRVNLVVLDFRNVNIVIVCAAGALCLLYLAALAKSRFPDRIPAEWAMLLLLILMFTPLSFNYAYVWLFFPLMVAIADGAPVDRRRRLAWIAWLSLVVSLLIVTIFAPRTTQAYGNLFFAALILYLGLGVRAIFSRPVGSDVVACGGG